MSTDDIMLSVLLPESITSSVAADGALQSFVRNESLYLKVSLPALMQTELASSVTPRAIYEVAAAVFPHRIFRILS